ncbi:MAG: hypothetical protein IJV37_03185 [Bacteroidales bacterium]|nr:hypothetical protein [Bacteroidales bacterium]
MVSKRILYYVATAIWAVPGIIITVKGIGAYCAMPAARLWWLLPCTAAVLCGFFFMFRKIARKYCTRIAALPERTTVWQTFPLRGWILIVFMMGLGMALKIIGVPAEFTASFYSGLGPMLLYASVIFLQNGLRSQ